MNLTAPIKVHSGLQIKITQPYGSTANIEWYKSRGINIPFHNGVDLVLTGSDKQNYGAELITPAIGWKIVKTTFDTPLSTKGNGVTIESPQFVEDGITKTIQCVYWHCSEVERDRPQEILPAYTTVGYMGNSGDVNPAPTPECPYCGTHLHLMLFEYHVKNGWPVLQNTANGVGGAIDPMTRFNIYNFITGKDTDISKDNPPLFWSFEKLGLKDSFSKIIYILKHYTKW